LLVRLVLFGKTSTKTLAWEALQPMWRQKNSAMIGGRGTETNASEA
jgi:hypothetical protein